MNSKGTLFISRAASDAPLASQIGRALEDAGYTVILQQWDFSNRNFVEAMHSALRSDARVIALLSPDYLESDYCSAEWQNAITGDPLNKQGRLIVLRVSECEPVGLLAGLVYWDLAGLHDNADLLAEVVRRAVSSTDRAAEPSIADAYLQTPKLPLPTGTVTFLFTEIEGSVERWERDPAATEHAVRRHGELLQSAIVAHRGRVFRASGEGYAAVFARPEDALSAALAAQRALRAEDFAAADDLRVAMAMHTGSVDLYDDDYMGPTVNRAARLLAIGHGGQVLVSGIAADALAGFTLESVELRDLGEHRLKDLTVPERVYQVVAPELLADFPPLRAIDVLPNNLPLQATRLIGRDEVVAEVRGLVEQHPLVSLIATGGVGKTRVALQVAADLLDGSADGVWFVDLAPLGDSSLVPGTVASTLGVRESQKEPVFETLLRHLKTRRMLIVLDNSEHVIDEVARLAADILRNCPQIHLLATSREALNVSGEHVVRLPPLDLPLEVRVTAAHVLAHGATALFAESASLVDARFVVTDENAPLVAEICRRLDGIPLAIELAAARVNVLSIAELARRLDERFRLLTGGSRTALPRQKTLHALIDWSYDLLSDQEKAVFRRLSAFAGGWTLEAAEAVCSGDPVDAPDILDLLSSLVAKSLVVPDVQKVGARYRLLESLRAYSAEKLHAEGERDAIARRHAAWIAAFAETAYTIMGDNSPPSRLVEHLAPEVENVREALRFSFASPDPLDRDLGGLIAGAVARYWWWVGLAREGRQWIDTAIAQRNEQPDDVVAARLWQQLALLAVATESGSAAQKAIDIYEHLGDKDGLAHSFTSLSWALWQSGRYEQALSASERTLQLLRELGKAKTRRFATALADHALALRGMGRIDDARLRYAEAFAIYDDLHDEESASFERVNLAELEFAAGNPSAALELAVEAANALARLGSPQEILPLTNVAGYHLALGHVEEARAASRDVQLRFQPEQFEYVLAPLEHLAAVSALLNDPRRAALLLGYTQQSRQNAGFEREATEQSSYEILMKSLKAQLTDEEIETLGNQGALLAEEQAIALALLI